jgi:hypothetical protein
VLKKLLVVTALLGGTLLPALPASAQGYPPPAPRYERRPNAPGPGYAWRGGEYHWNGNRYVWAPGFYVRPPYGHGAWVPGRWVRRYHRWVWVPGHWRRA